VNSLFTSTRAKVRGPFNDLMRLKITGFARIV